MKLPNLLQDPVLSVAKSIDYPYIFYSLYSHTQKETSPYKNGWDGHHSRQCGMGWDWQYIMAQVVCHSAVTANHHLTHPHTNITPDDIWKNNVFNIFDCSLFSTGQCINDSKLFIITFY